MLENQLLWSVTVLFHKNTDLLLDFCKTSGSRKSEENRRKKLFKRKEGEKRDRISLGPETYYKIHGDKK